MIKKPYTSRPKPSMDYPNDRKILFLLSHKKELTYSEKRKLRKLSNIYQDNHLFSKELTRELSASHFIESENLEPYKPKRSETGAVVQHSLRWYTTNRGIEALRNGRFLSERAQITKKARFLALQWTSIIIGSISVLIGILTFFFKDFIDIMNSFFH